ncbi:hypothetical protein [Nostoc sp.]|uniref:hypothetical protein n=1 Tax=Nostoc sp. TaxID=1180 RepID=UPI002FF96951
MSIITFLALNGARKNTDYFSDIFSDRLACGNAWEYSLTENLKTQGLDKVYQLDQYIPHRAVYGDFRTDPENWRKRDQSRMPQDLYPKFQRDIRIIHNGKGWNCEVKSKSGIFKDHNILVGGIATRWERYKFPVHFVIAIDRATGEARVTEADRLTRETSWLRIKAEELSYGVPRHLFKPLDSWLDFIKVK